MPLTPRPLTTQTYILLSLLREPATIGSVAQGAAEAASRSALAQPLTAHFYTEMNRLMNAGMVEPTKKRKGRAARRWRLTTAGRARARAEQNYINGLIAA